MSKSKEVLTTGEVARICNVAPRTVSKWFDSGQLRGYRIPGSKDRRIPLTHLIRFMKAHGMPVAGLETGETRLLIVDEDAELTGLLQRTLSDSGGYEVQTADSAFEAGVRLEQFKPSVVLADVDLPGIDGRVLSRFVSTHPEFHDTRLIAMSGSLTEADRQTLLQRGFDDTIAKPFTIRQLTDVIEGAVSVMV